MKLSIIAASFVSFGLILVSGAQGQNAPKEHSMTGCLKAGTAANSYILTDVEGSGPKTVGIVSSDTNLSPHVGHKIEVTGTAVPAKEAETENKDVPKAPHYMKLTSIKMVSTSCP
jgi:hypothetical protein